MSKKWKSKAQKKFDKLSAFDKAVIATQVFNLLEFDSEGNPGVEWNSDTASWIGNVFENRGIVWSNPDDHYDEEVL